MRWEVFGSRGLVGDCLAVALDCGRPAVTVLRVVRFGDPDRRNQVDAISLRMSTFSAVVPVTVQNRWGKE